MHEGTQEPRADVERRQIAARCWTARFAEKHRNRTGETTDPHRRALAVIVLSHGDYLAEHDPQALKQAQLAMDGTCFEEFVNQHPCQSVGE